MAVGQIEHLRGVDWFRPSDHEDRSVTIVGCGGIGSFTALALAKMFGPEGPEINLIDKDVVEPHNIPNQLFSHTQVGLPKVNAIEGLCRLFGGAKIGVTAHGDIREHTNLLTDMVVCGLDSMEIRKWIFHYVNGNKFVNRLIDGRLLGQYITIYSINPQEPLDTMYYGGDEILFDDSDAEEAVCTARAIIDVGMMVGAHMATAVRLAMTTPAGEAVPFHTMIHDVEHQTLDVGRTLGSRKKVVV